MRQKILFIEHNGTEHEVLTEPGTSVMQAALDHGVPGIVGECGGCCSCATCHGYVNPPWSDRIAPASPEEAELASCAFDPMPQSRLTCLIKLTPEVDGIVIRLPQRQF